MVWDEAVLSSAIDVLALMPQPRPLAFLCEQLSSQSCPLWASLILGAGAGWGARRSLAESRLAGSLCPSLTGVLRVLSV